MGLVIYSSLANYIINAYGSYINYFFGRHSMSPASVPARDRAEHFGLRPPASTTGLLEARALFEFSSLLPAVPGLLTLPRGDGRPVMTLPGFGADDASTCPPVV